MKKFIAIIILFVMSVSVYVDAAIYRCDACPAGYYCPDGGNQYQCGAGTYSNMGATSCTNCPSGQYQPNSGQSGCITCTSSQEEICTYTYEDCYTHSDNCPSWSACITACAFAPFPFSLVCDSSCDKCETCNTKTATGKQTVYYQVNSSRTSCDVYSRSECKKM